MIKERKNTLYNKKSCLQGQNLLEFALVLPLLLLIVFGVLDLGRVFYSTIGLQGAVREGARYFTIHPEEINKTAEIVQANAKGYGLSLSLADIVISCEGDVCEEDNYVNVSASTQFDLILGLFSSSTINLTQSTRMMILVSISPP